VNLLEDKTDGVKKNISTLSDASKEFDLEVNIDEIKYMLLSHYQNPQI
jgi:hypothetical protein